MAGCLGNLGTCPGEAWSASERRIWPMCTLGESLRTNFEQDYQTSKNEDTYGGLEVASTAPEIRKRRFADILRMRVQRMGGSESDL